MNIRFVIASVALLALGAVAQDATWIPASATGAFYADEKALRTMPVMSKYNNGKMPDASPFAAIVKQSQAIFGDINKQTDKGIAAIIPDKAAKCAHSVAFMSGTFDVDAIAAKMKAEPKCKVVVKEGVTVYALPMQVPNIATNAPASTMTYFAMPRKGVLVSSDSVDTLLLGIKTMQKKSPAVAKDSKIAAAISKAYPIVGVTDMSTIMKKGEKLPYVNVDPPSFVAFTLRAKDEQTVVGTLTGVFASEEDAANVVTTLSGLKAITAMQMATKPDTAPFADLIASIDLGNKGASAFASLLLSEKTIDLLISNLKLPGLQ